MVPIYSVLVAFCVLILEVQLAKERLFIGDCSYRFCEQHCTQVEATVMKCYCRRGFSLKEDGRKCIKSFDDDEDISGDGASGEPGNCDNEDGNCDKSKAVSGEEDIEVDEGSGSESFVVSVITPFISKISMKVKESAKELSSAKDMISITSSQVTIRRSVSVKGEYSNKTVVSTAEHIKNTQIHRNESSRETTFVKDIVSISKSSVISGVSPLKIFIQITPIQEIVYISKSPVISGVSPLKTFIRLTSIHTPKLQTQITIKAATVTVNQLLSMERLTPRGSVFKHISSSSSYKNTDLPDVKLGKINKSTSVSLLSAMSSLSSIVKTESLLTTLISDKILDEKCCTIYNLDGDLTYSTTSDIQSIYNPSPIVRIKPNTTVMTNDSKVVEEVKSKTTETGALDISMAMGKIITVESTPTMSTSIRSIIGTFTPRMIYSEKKEVLKPSSTLKLSSSVSVVIDDNIRVIEMDGDQKVPVKFKEIIDESTSLPFNTFMPKTVMTTSSISIFPLEETPSYIKSAAGKISKYVEKSEDSKQSMQSILYDSETFMSTTVIPKSGFDKFSTANIIRQRTTPLEIIVTNIMTSSSLSIFPIKGTPSYIKRAAGETSIYVDKREESKQSMLSILHDSESMKVVMSSTGMKIIKQTDRKSIIQSSTSKAIRETILLRSTNKTLTETTKQPKVTIGSDGYRLVISYYVLSLFSFLNIIYLL